ncbi:uncharacterized protein LOC109840451 [Asparagus officinalis]|uniref:uncharacterized protein LOC109840451 n=1 Tax=Asparagus officinalis TaxID=4686 RepID=UPI00098E541B|nr:uncharacterized protein LOC109840451 [Asparagus officinalis]
MDFHSLPRRALQALCKRNKIPANMTNIAMADALSSLQSVEGLDQILEEIETPTKAPSPTPTRPPNPARSCRKNSPFVWSENEKQNKKRRAKQESPDSPTPKRSRTLWPTRLTCRKVEDNDDDEEVGSMRKMLPLSTLVPCTESSACLKTYCREISQCSVEPVDGVSSRSPVLGCSSTVRRNAEASESAELAVGGVAECIQVGDERRRSIGVQVDIQDLDNCSLEISAPGDQMPRLTYEKEADADAKVCNRGLDLVKKHQETTCSCSLPTSQLLDKECIHSSGNLQLATCSPKPCPESLNMLPNVGDLSGNQETSLLEMGDPLVEYHETDVKIAEVALNRGLVLEDCECGKREFVGIHSGHGQVTNVDEENGNSNVLEVVAPTVKSCGSNNTRGSLALSPAPSLEGGEGEKKVFVSSHGNHGGGIDPVKANESANVPSDTGDHDDTRQNPSLKNVDGIVKSHTSDDSIGSLSLNRGPVLEHGEGERRELGNIHGSHGEGSNMDKENETSNMRSIIVDPIQRTSLLEIGEQLEKSYEIDDRITIIALNCGPAQKGSEDEKRKLVSSHNNHGEGGVDMGRDSESSSVPSIIEDHIGSPKTLLLKNSDPIVKASEPDGSVGSLALDYCPVLENIEDEKREFVGVHSNQGGFTAGLDQENGSSNMPFSTGDLASNPQTSLLKIGDPTVKPLESDDSVGSLTPEANEGQKRELAGVYSNNGEGANMEKEKDEPKSGGGTKIDIKTENQSERKRDLSGLSLRKLRLLYKENKQVIQMDIEGACRKDEKVHNEDKQNPEEAKLNGLSLRKLKILYKHKATNNRIKHGM